MLPTGRVKVLATSGAKRSPPMPAVPTFVELGYKEVIASAWFSYYAPAKTPAPIVDKLHGEMAKIIATGEMRERFLGIGADPVGNTPAQFAAFIRAELKKWEPTVRASGARVEELLA